MMPARLLCALVLCLSAAALAAQPQGGGARSEFDGADTRRGASGSAAGHTDARRKMEMKETVGDGKAAAEMDAAREKANRRTTAAAGASAADSQTALNDCASGRVC